MLIALRADFDARSMRVAAKRAKDAAQARRLLALAAIYEGASRSKAAEIGGVTRQIVRDWVVRFNADGPEGLINRKAPGQPSRWAKKGTRPSAPHDQRTASTYIFGAICPKDGKGATLVLPKCDTFAMNLHLEEIAKNVAPGAHAVIILDQAGWHTTDKLAVRANITILPLPPKCPELNPAENVWQFLRDNWLSNRVFKSYDDVVDQCCHAWNKLIDQPWRIMSIGLRDWAQGF